MTSLRALLSTLASQAGPVLTVYSKERVEFNGPVLARWFSKISNLLSEELGADLFGEGEAHSGRFFIRHELWQEIVWTVPLLALGWTRLGSLEEAARAISSSFLPLTRTPSRLASRGRLFWLSRANTWRFRGGAILYPLGSSTPSPK